MPAIKAEAGGKVYVAPGSGIKDWSYGINLARRWPQADEIYGQVLQATGVDIYDVCFAPKDSAPTDPAVTQPAAYGIGYASADFLKHEIGPPNYLMGLSASEFTVAAISGALTLKEGAYLSKKRGEYQRDVAGGLGGSAMLLMHNRLDAGRRKHEILSLLAEVPGVHVSNFHTPFKIGIGFSNEELEEDSASQLLDRLTLLKGVRRALHNKGVEFPPHGKQVAAAEEMLESLMRSTTKVRDAAVPIVANYTGRLMKKGRTIRNNLIWQTTSPTQLNRGMDYLINMGVKEYWDIGPDTAMQKLLGDFETLHGVSISSATELV